MQVSPLQPDAIVFQRVSIVPFIGPEKVPVQANGFDFAGVNITCNIGHGYAASHLAEGAADRMLVTIHTLLTNENGKPAPYTVDIEVSGLFRWLDDKTDEALRRDLIVVNGATLLYGAVREMVLMVTSRCVAGAMLLPSVNFIDNKPSLAKPGEYREADAPPIGASGSVKRLKAPNAKKNPAVRKRKFAGPVEG